MPLDDGNPLHEAWMEEQQAAMQNQLHDDYDFSTYVQQQQAAVQAQYEAWRAGLAGRLQNLYREREARSYFRALVENPTPEQDAAIRRYVAEHYGIDFGYDCAAATDEPGLTLWDHLMADDY